MFVPISLWQAQRIVDKFPSICKWYSINERDIENANLSASEVMEHAQKRVELNLGFMFM